MQLEHRVLLTGVGVSGEVGAWNGQAADAHDFVGQSKSPGPNAGNGYRDLHLSLSNLPHKTIVFADIRRDGGDK